MGILDKVFVGNVEPLKEKAVSDTTRSTHNVSASRGRRAIAMQGRPAGPNTAVTPEQPVSRDRARDAVRNSPYIANGLRALVKHEIGTGITCTFRFENEELEKQVQDLWNRSMPEMFADGVGHLYAGERLMSRGRNESGEVFIRRRRRRTANLAVPVQFQLLETDMLDTSYNQENLDNGNRITAGIELNKSGERVAYWFFLEHPNDIHLVSYAARIKRVRIPARDVIHHYIPLRAGQLRGMPTFTSALFKNANLEAYDDYELERKKKHASYTGTIEREAKYDHTGRQIDPLTGTYFPDDMEIPEIRLTPDTIVQLGDGEKLNLFDAEKGGEFYADYMRQQLMSICAAYGVPYEIITGDWKAVNDRILRAILNDFQREIEAIQEIYLIQQVLRPMTAWWLDAAVLSGAISLPDYANRREEYLNVDWRPQGWAYVHPQQDAQAAILRIENDLSTHEKEARKLNMDSQKCLEANIRHAAHKQKLLSEAGLLVEPDEADADEEDS